MPPAARFREDLVQKRSASGAKERDLDERIFFFEAIHGLFALIQSHRRVINDLPLFFGPFDKFWVRLPLRQETDGIAKMEKISRPTVRLQAHKIMQSCLLVAVK